MLHNFEDLRGRVGSVEPKTVAVAIFSVDNAVCRGHTAYDHVIGVRTLSLGHTHA